MNDSAMGSVLYTSRSKPKDTTSLGEGVAPERSDHDLYQLAYCSILKQAPTELEAQALVAHAQARNRGDGITGLLMLDSQGLVIQWIEGPRYAVRALWARLLTDPRHNCIVELMHRDYPLQRLFPDWSMRPASRREMLDIVREGHNLAQMGQPSPWSEALAALTILLEPQYAKTLSLH
jgi:hypothetical protein